MLTSLSPHPLDAQNTCVQNGCSSDNVYVVEKGCPDEYVAVDTGCAYDDSYGSANIVPYLILGGVVSAIAIAAAATSSGHHHHGHH